MFERWWQSLPKEMRAGASKKDAKKAWDKLKPNAGMVELIMDSVQKQDAWRKANALLPKAKQVFIPNWKHPATWIRQEGWNIEVPDTREKPKTRIVCTDCGGEFRARYEGEPYCLRCYDKHAHPELGYT